MEKINNKNYNDCLNILHIVCPQNMFYPICNLVGARYCTLDVILSKRASKKKKALY